MAEPKIEGINEKSFIKELFSRRVPQILGIYIGVSWGIIQFIDWLVNRYLWSGHLTDLAIVVLLSLIPTAMIIAYYHGSPGRNTWTRIEKVTIPLNLMISVFLLIFLFSGKDLGSVTKTVTIEDDKGNTVNRVIAKSEFRKRVAMFSFENRSGDKELNWLRDGLLSAIHFDLMQDLFVETQSAITSDHILKRIDKSGFSRGVKIPFALQRKIAGEYHLKYFFVGSFKKENNQFHFQTHLYETKPGKLLAKNDFQGSNLFNLVDEITKQLRIDLDIPKRHIEQTGDLPVAEILTSSTKALKQCIHGLQALNYNRDFAAAIKYFDRAASLDPAYAIVQYLRGAIYTNLNQPDKARSALDLAMKHLYKLPERFKYQVKGLNYVLNNEAGKYFKLINMQVELYPDDIDAHLTLAALYNQQNKTGLAISEYEKIMRLIPDPYIYYHDIGELHLKNGETAKGTEYFQKYADKFPKQFKSFKKLGQLFERTGDNQQAISFYDRALMIEPEDIETMLDLADVRLRTGEFDTAQRDYQNALAKSKTDEEKTSVYLRFENFYSLKGQIRKALDYYKLKMAARAKFLSPLQLFLSKLFNLSLFVKAGDEKTAFSQVREIGASLKPPFDQLSAFGYTSIYLETRDPLKGEEQVAKIKGLIKTFGPTLSGAQQFVLKASGLFMEMKGQYQEAIASFKEFAAIDPTFSSINRNIGRCYRKLKNYEKAEEHLHKILKINPFHPKTNYEIGILYMETGKIDKAKEHLKIAVEVWKHADENYKPAIKARKRYQELIKQI